MTQYEHKALVEFTQPFRESVVRGKLLEPAQVFLCTVVTERVCFSHVSIILGKLKMESILVVSWTTRLPNCEDALAKWGR